MTGYLWATQALAVLGAAVLAAASWCLFVAGVRDLRRDGNCRTDAWVETMTALTHRPPPTVERRPVWAWDALFDARSRHPAGGDSQSPC